ncbi:hypothetical protein [uncultured Arthrobacter sp.]|uniref:hypothetical protein n=1 Tax=uncultured Arthrobacter sp. TaxID=114050 RepID=UPI002615D351|nr:hypothetical protein [uncultured Arthrobacter sp.]
MRWKALFEDIEAQLAAADQALDDAEVADRVRQEQGAVTLADRFRGQLGFILRVGTSGGGSFDGELTHVGSEWLVLSTQPGEVMVPFTAVRLVEGLSRNVLGEASRVQKGLGLGSALRTLARDRAAVTVHIVESATRIEGIIDRVGKDFLEIAAVLPGEARRTTSVSAVYAVPFSGLAAVSSR